MIIPFLDAWRFIKIFQPSFPNNLRADPMEETRMIFTT
jgi:hypothetical protein